MKLKQKYSKQTDSVRALKYSSRTCMRRKMIKMSTSFSTQNWIDLINRAGLYRINNDAYMLF